MLFWNRDGDMPRPQFYFGILEYRLVTLGYADEKK